MVFTMGKMVNFNITHGFYHGKMVNMFIHMTNSGKKLFLKPNTEMRFIYRGFRRKLFWNSDWVKSTMAKSTIDG